jgi:hypothetical protein
MISSYGISKIIFQKIYDRDNSSIRLAGEFNIEIEQIKDPHG